MSDIEVLMIDDALRLTLGTDLTLVVTEVKRTYYGCDDPVHAFQLFDGDGNYILTLARCNKELTGEVLREVCITARALYPDHLTRKNS